MSLLEHTYGDYSQELCRHKMSSMPRWLSSSKVEIVRCDQSRLTQNHHLLPFTLPLMRRRNLLAEDPAMMCAWDRTVLPCGSRLKPTVPTRSLRETLGISADGSNKAYRGDDIQAFMNRKPTVIPYNPRDPSTWTNHIFVAVDPSGGGPSAFSIASVVCLPGGQFQVRSPPLVPPRPRPLGPTCDTRLRPSLPAHRWLGLDWPQSWAW